MTSFTSFPVPPIDIEDELEAVGNGQQARASRALAAPITCSAGL